MLTLAVHVLVSFLVSAYQEVLFTIFEVILKTLGTLCGKSSKYMS